MLSTAIAIGSDIEGMPVTRPLADFACFPVNISSAEECNAFVISLCHQLDEKLRLPDVDRAPWKYTPYLQQLNHISLVTLGNVSTRVGVFTVVMECKERRIIKNVYFYNIHGAHKLEQSLLEEVVKDAISLRHSTNTFFFKARLLFKHEDLSMQNYYGPNFCIKSVGKDSWVEFKLEAIDLREANDLARQKLTLLCHFLALETNLLVEYTDFSEIDSMSERNENEPMLRYPAYVDGYPIEGTKVYLSNRGYNFISDFVFTPRNTTDNLIANKVLAAAGHVYEGLMKEAGLENEVKFVGPTQIFAVAPVTYRSQDICSKAMMSYMSAVEIATINEGKPDKCATCGTDLYHITARVKDMATKYLNEELGKIFGSLYSMRSKYLHAGVYATGFDQGHPRPVFDVNSPNLLVPRKFVTIKYGGRSVNLFVTNVREWTTLLLRAYYCDVLYNDSISLMSLEENVGSYFPVRAKKPTIQTDLPGLEISDVVFV